MPQKTESDETVYLAKQNLEATQQKLQQASAKFQGGLIERMQLKARVQDCLTLRCDPFKVRAEEIAKRLGLDGNKQQPPTAAEFIPSAE